MAIITGGRTIGRQKHMFTYRGRNQTVVVPSDIRYMEVKIWGAGGGGERGVGPNCGGSGGYCGGKIDLENSSFVSTYGNLKGSTLYVCVGRGGNQGQYLNVTNPNPFYGGGGKAQDHYNQAGSELGDGGGLSGIFLASPYTAPSNILSESVNYSVNATLAQTLAIAGGGGGAGDANNGGAGGGTTGGNGGGPTTGGTQSGGTGTGTAAGRFLLGGSNVANSGNTYRAGGGGGGLYGGQGAQGNRHGGAGGSGYSGGLTSDISLLQGTQGNSSSGLPNIPPNYSDGDMIGFVGYGGGAGDNNDFVPTGGTYTGTTGIGHAGAGGNGLVVIRFLD